LHSPEDRITVATVTNTNFGEFGEIGQWHKTSVLRLEVQKFSINGSGEVSRVLSRPQNIFLGKYLSIRHTSYLGEMTFGGYQSSTFFDYEENGPDHTCSCFLSLEPNGNTVRCEFLPGSLCSFQVFPVDNYLAYYLPNNNEGIGLLRSKLSKPSVHRYAMIQEEPPDEYDFLCADSDFVVFFRETGLAIWVFDETWVPPPNVRTCLSGVSTK